MAPFYVNNCDLLTVSNVSGEEELKLYMIAASLRQPPSFITDPHRPLPHPPPLHPPSPLNPHTPTPNPALFPPTNLLHKVNVITFSKGHAKEKGD